MNAARLNRLLQLVHWSAIGFWTIWMTLGAVIIVALLLAMMYTPLGRRRPFTKSLALSAIAHLLLAYGLASIPIAASMLILKAPEIRVSLAEIQPAHQETDRFGGAVTDTARRSDSASSARQQDVLRDAPWEAFGRDSTLKIKPTEMARVEVKSPDKSNRRPSLRRVISPAVHFFGIRKSSPPPHCGNLRGSPPASRPGRRDPRRSEQNTSMRPERKAGQGHTSLYRVALRSNDNRRQIRPRTNLRGHERITIFPRFCWCAP